MKNILIYIKNIFFDKNSIVFDKCFIIKNIKIMKLIKEIVSVRLILGFGLVLSLTLILAIVGISKTKKISNLATIMYKHPMKVIKIAKNIKASVFAIQSYMNKAGIANYIVEINALKSTIKEYEKDVYYSFERISKITKDSLQLSRVSDSYENWSRLNAELIDLFKERDREKALKLYKKEVEVEARTFNKEISLLIYNSKKDAEIYIKKAKSNEKSMITTTSILLSIIFISGILFVFYIIRKLSKTEEELKMRGELEKL